MLGSYLKYIEICNFRSFFGYHKIPFNKNGLCLLKGSNLDSKGESGAGKSSILLAISYVLGFGPRFAAKELQSWDSEEPMYVSLCLGTPKGEVVIARGEKFKLTLNNEEIKGSAAYIESEIDSLIGVSAELRKLMTYREQGSKGMFFSMTDSDKKDFLKALLNIKWIEDCIEEISNNIKVLDKTFENVCFNLTRVKVEKDTLSEPTIPVSLITEQLQIDMEALKLQYSTLFDEIKVLKDHKANSTEAFDLTNIKKLEELIIGIDVNVKEILQQKQIKQNSIIELKVATAQISSELKTLPKIKDKIDSLKKDIELLENSLCPTCNQSWENESLLNKKQEQLSDLTKKIEELNDKEKDIQISENKIVIVNVDVRSLDVEIESLNKQKSDFQADILKEKLRLQNPLVSLETEISNKTSQSLSLKIKINDGLSKIKEIEQNNKHNLDLYKINKNAYDQKIEYINKLELQKEQLTKEFNLEKDSLELLKGFYNKIFDEVLREIESDTNDILASLSNVSHVSLEFNSERQTQKGTTKESITPVISFNGQNRAHKSGLSGGMSTSVELAVDLAVIDVISRRTGCNLGWLMFDEAFNGLDIITKEACLEVLKKYGRNKLIIVIDHASETKELFDQVIDIEYKNGKSYIKGE